MNVLASMIGDRVLSVLNDSFKTDRDLEIAREVTHVCPEIVVHIAAPGTTAADIDDWKWKLPTLTVSLGILGASCHPGG